MKRRTRRITPLGLEPVWTGVGLGHRLGEFRLALMGVDRKTPTSKGGPNDDSNLQLLCGHCNKIKGDNRTMAEARVRLAELGIVVG